MPDRAGTLPEDWDECFALATVYCLTCHAAGLITKREMHVPDDVTPDATVEAVCAVCACQPQARLLYTETSPFRVLSVVRVRIVG